MATLAEIRYDIIQRVKGQVVSDDERLEESYIDKLIRDKRNFIIRDEAKRGLGIHSGWMQDITCLEVKCGEVQCDGIPAGVAYSYVDWPAGAVGNVAYFGTADGSSQFSHWNISAFLLARPTRFGKEPRRYTVVGGKALLKGVPSEIDRVRLIAAVDDPIAAFGVCGLDGENQVYPVPVHQVSRLQSLVLMDLLPVRNILPDTFNNANDETVPSQVNPKLAQAFSTERQEAQ